MIELVSIIAFGAALLALVGIALLSRVNATDDDDPPTILAKPVLNPDDGKW